MTRYVLVFVLVAAFVLTACAKKTETTTEATASAAAPEAVTTTAATAATSAPTPAGGKTYTIVLKALNGSNESGTATIIDTANEAGIHTSTIQVALSNAPAGKQAVNIYQGTCPPTKLASVFLEPAVNGKMSHELGGFGIESFKGSVIAVWSGEDPSQGKYVSCGAISP